MHRSWLPHPELDLRALGMHVVLALFLGTGAAGLTAAFDSAGAGALQRTEVASVDSAGPPFGPSHWTLPGSGDPTQSPAPRRSRTSRLNARNLPRASPARPVHLAIETPVAATLRIVSDSVDRRCAGVALLAEDIDRRHERLALASRAGHLSVPPPSLVPDSLEVV